MSVKLAENRIQNVFSRCAEQYEELSDMQAEIGQELLKKIKGTVPFRGPLPDSILDVGMGTGRMWPGLHNLFPDAQVTGMDLAFGMLRVARNKYNHSRLIQADAAYVPFKADSFDLAVSNVSYQWVRNLKQAFEQIQAVLKGGGIFYCTMFGYETLRELFDSFENAGLTEQVRGRERLKRLLNYSQIYKTAKEAGFHKVEGTREIKKVYFKDMLALLRWLKGIGANGLSPNFFIGKDALRRAGAYYRSHYAQDGRVYASFEVVWLKAHNRG